MRHKSKDAIAFEEWYRLNIRKLDGLKASTVVEIAKADLGSSVRVTARMVYYCDESSDRKRAALGRPPIGDDRLGELEARIGKLESQLLTK